MSVDPLPVRSDLGPRRQQLPDEVASYVRELIISGQMRPGTFLRMDRIAEAIGVSNTPVREGLLILSSEGFVSQVPRRGYVVAPFTRQDIRDLFWAQATLAGELAARAAKKISPEQVARAEDIMARYEVASEAKDEQGLADLGHAFHREINLAADSLRLANLLGSVVKQLPQRSTPPLKAGSRRPASSTRLSSRRCAKGTRGRRGALWSSTFPMVPTASSTAWSSEASGPSYPAANSRGCRASKQDLARPARQLQ